MMPTDEEMLLADQDSELRARWLAERKRSHKPGKIVSPQSGVPYPWTLATYAKSIGWDYVTHTSADEREPPR